ncbi:MAG: QcrA and Rieske domain-containing protein [Gaiellaceae bacterium]
MSHDPDENPHVPAPSLWPVGFAIGLACILVGLVVSWPAVVIGAALAIVFGTLWIRDLARSEPHGDDAEALAGGAVEDEHVETYGRAGFLTVATIGLGGVIGAGVTLPSLGFAVLPSFNGKAADPATEVDLGPLENFPEGQYVIANFLEDPSLGEVSRRTAYVRYNGPSKGGEPSFTTIFSRCVHLGCPVQPNGPTFEDKVVKFKDVTLTPVQPAGFGCPCHGGAYDAEGNRTAGPPVRSLDRYEFAIVNGNVVLGRLFSVGTVTGTGADARITKYRRSYPGIHVDGPEKWLYPIPVPGS